MPSARGGPPAAPCRRSSASGRRPFHSVRGVRPLAVLPVNPVDLLKQRGEPFTPLQAGRRRLFTQHLLCKVHRCRQTSLLSFTSHNGGEYLHHQPKTAPDSLRGPDVRPQGRGRFYLACDSSGATRAGAWLANRTQPAARDRAGCCTPLNHTACAHRRRVRSASSAPWRHTEACLPAWIASASHASAASRSRPL